MSTSKYMSRTTADEISFSLSLSLSLPFSLRGTTLDSITSISQNKAIKVIPPVIARESLRGLDKLKNKKKYTKYRTWNNEVRPECVFVARS